MSYRRNQEIRRQASRFRSLVASPASGKFNMPSNAFLYVRALTDIATESPCASIGSREVSSPPLDSGSYHNIGFVERGVEVEVYTGFDLYFISGLDNRSKIAEAE